MKVGQGVCTLPHIESINYQKGSFAIVLRITELQYEQAKLCKIEEDKTINIQTFWKYARTRKDHINTIYSVNYQGTQYSEPAELRIMLGNVYSELLIESTALLSLYICHTVVILSSRFE